VESLTQKMQDVGLSGNVTGQQSILKPETESVRPLRLPFRLMVNRLRFLCVIDRSLSLKKACLAQIMQRLKSDAPIQRDMTAMPGSTTAFSEGWTGVYVTKIAHGVATVTTRQLFNISYIFFGDRNIIYSVWALKHPQAPQRLPKVHI